MTVVEHEAGRCGPLPEWAGYVLAAKWYGVAPWELLASDDAAFWREAAMLFRSIESEQHERERKKS